MTGDNKEEKKDKMVSLIENVPSLGKAIELVEPLQQSILDGNNSALKTVMFFKKMGKIAEELTKGELGERVKHEIEQEFILYNTKGSTALAHGNKAILQLRGWFDFTDCNDIVWDKLQEIKNQIDELIKTRESQLKLTVPSDSIKIEQDGNLNIGGGVQQTNIGVSYMPELKLHPTDDLLIINPPKHGKKPTMVYHV